MSHEVESPIQEGDIPGHSSTHIEPLINHTYTTLQRNVSLCVGSIIIYKESELTYNKQDKKLNCSQRVMVKFQSVRYEIMWFDIDMHHD